MCGAQHCYQSAVEVTEVQCSIRSTRITSVERALEDCRGKAAIYKKTGRFPREQELTRLHFDMRTELLYSSERHCQGLMAGSYSLVQCMRTLYSTPLYHTNIISLEEC
jgi:hypothetical protein